MIEVAEYDPEWAARFGRLRDEYADVKRRLGAGSANGDEYTAGKNAIILRILAAAGLSEADRSEIEAN